MGRIWYLFFKFLFFWLTWVVVELVRPTLISAFSELVVHAEYGSCVTDFWLSFSLANLAFPHPESFSSLEISEWLLERRLGVHYKIIIFFGCKLIYEVKYKVDAMIDCKKHASCLKDTLRRK